MPHLSLSEEAVRVKGSALTEDEEKSLAERGQYAKFWLSTYAPEEFKYELQKQMPSASLSDVQKKALAALADYFASGERTGDELHLKLHELKTEVPIQPKELFQAIYTIFLKRDSGPKAGWFLAGLPREFVVTRLKEAVS
jgi:lysyl-tRNA synthetase class 1